MAGPIATLTVLITGNAGQFESSMAGTEKRLATMGGRMTSIGSSMTKGITLPIIAIGGAVVLAALNVDKGQRIIAQATGETGKALNDTFSSAKKVFANVPESMTKVAEAISLIKQRTNESGKPLENFTTQIMNLARIGKANVTDMANSVTAAFKNWNISTAQQSSALDFLYKVTAKTGIPIQSLTDGMIRAQAPCTQMGLDYKETAGLLGLLAEHGITGTRAMMGLVTGSKTVSKEFPNSTHSLQDFIDKIHAAGPSTASYNEVVKAFGTRIGPVLYQMITQGTLGIDGFVKTLDGSKTTINGVADHTHTLAQTFEIMGHKLMIAVEPLGKELVAAGKRAIGAMKPVVGAIKDVIGWFTRLPKGVQIAVGAIVGIAAALGPVLLIAGKVMKMFGAMSAAWETLSSSFLISPLGITIMAIVAVAIVAAVLIKKYWKEIGPVLERVWKDIKSAFDKVWPPLKKFFLAIWDPIKEFFKRNWETIKKILEVVWKVIGVIAKVYWEYYKIYFTVLWDIVKTIFKVAWWAIRDIIIPIFKVIFAVAKVVFTALKVFFTVLWAVVKTVFQVAWWAIRDIVLPIWHAIVAVAKVVWTVLKAFFLAIWIPVKAVWKVVWTIIRTELKIIWTIISQVGQVIFGVLAAIFKVIWDVLVTVWKAVWDVISGILQGVWNALVAVWNVIFPPLKAVAMAIWDALVSAWQSVWGGIKAVVSDVWNGIVGAWHAVMDPLINVARSIWDGLVGAWQGAWSTLKGVVRDAVNIVIGIINDLIHAWNLVPFHSDVKSIAPMKHGGGLIMHGGGMVFDSFQYGGLKSNERPTILEVGEFVERKAAVNKYGLDFMRAVNEGSYNPAAAAAGNTYILNNPAFPSVKTGRDMDDVKSYLDKLSSDGNHLRRVLS